MRNGQAGKKKPNKKSSFDYIDAVVCEYLGVSRNVGYYIYVNILSIMLTQPTQLLVHLITTFALSPHTSLPHRGISYRFVARSGITRLKRYQIDRVFRTDSKRSATATAKEAWEADFDIVAIGSCTSSVTSSNLAANSLVSAKTGYAAAGEEGGEVGEGAAFEVAEAEAVLVVSQVKAPYTKAAFCEGGVCFVHK